MTGHSGTAGDNPAYGRNGRRLVPMLLASTILGCAGLGAPSPAQAQNQERPRLAAADRTTQFSIPSQSLASAIDAFIRQTGWQISYGSALAGGRTSGAVVGAYTPAQALRQLVAGTGLSVRISAPGSAALVDPGVAAVDTVDAGGALVLDTIDVTGGGESSVYTPYETAAAANHISAERIERFRGSSPADILRGTPGVMSGEARNGAGSIDANIRGMQGFGRVATTIDGAENVVTVYQGYQGVSNRTFVDPDFIAGVDILKGADASSWGNAGSVAMRTVSADDIIKPGDTWGVRVKGGFGTNTSKPNAGDTAGYRFASGSAAPLPSETGLDRPSFLTPTTGSASMVAAFKQEDFDFLAGYARRKQGNYHAGKHGSGSVDPVFSDNRWINDGLVNYRPGEEILNTQLDTESWLFKATAHLAEDQTLQFGYTGFRSEAGDRLASRQSGNSGQPEQQAQTAGTSLDTITARYRWNPDDNDLVNLRASLYWTHLELRNPIRGGRALTPEQLGLGADFRVGSDTDMWGADVTNLSKFSFDHGDLDLTTGFSYRAEDTRGSRYTAPLEAWNTPRDAIRHEVAGFAKATWKPREWDWLTLNAGLRYSHYWSKDRYDPYEAIQANSRPVGLEKDAGGFSPSIGVTVEPFDGVQLYANYSNALRAPSVFESVNAFNSAFGQDDVMPERSRNWEIGANLTRDGLLSPDDRGMLKFSYFNWDVKNYISRVSTANISELLKTVNIHSAKFAGVELSGRYEVGGFTAELAANYFIDVEYCRTADTCDNKSIYSDYATNHVQPEYTIDLTLSQKLFDDRFTFGGRVLHVGPRAIGHGDVTGQGLMQFISPVTWKPHTLVDVFAEYKVNDNFTASFRVENLFDRFYVDPLGLVTQPGPGRTFYASLTGTFGGGQPLPQFSQPFIRDGNGTGLVDWTGLYGGAHAGLARSRIRGSTTVLVPGDAIADAIAGAESADLDFGGHLFGVQAGYNHQFSNRVVLGVEADFSKVWANGSQDAFTEAAWIGPQQDVVGLQAQTSYDIDWTASLRGRFGYALADRWLAYGTAGLAFARETQWRDQYRYVNDTYAGGATTRPANAEKVSETRIGYTLGGGLEYAINDRWSIRGDYSYSGFARKGFRFENAREGTGRDYTVTEVVGWEEYYPVEPGSPICAIPGFESFCEPWQRPITETTAYEGSSSRTNGRKASNSLDFHTFKIGLNYRF